MRWFVAAILAVSTAAPLMAQNHGQTDHSQMDHSTHAMQNAPQNEEGIDDSQMGEPVQRSKTLPAPVSVGPNAADAIWGRETMRASRDALYKEHGDMQIFWFQGDRAEYRIREGDDGYLWDVQGYYGGDTHKFWFKSEGEGSFGESIEAAEIQALYSLAIAPFFDLQAGIRQDLNSPERTHAVIGIQGLAPYMFEVDAAVFLSGKRDFTARIEAEYDQRITQKLVIQPRAEVNLSAQDIPELGIGAGVDNLELGLRLRFEIVPEFAPYVGIEQEWKLGGSRSFARLAGEEPGATSYVIGARFWF